MGDAGIFDLLLSPVDAPYTAPRLHAHAAAVRLRIFISHPYPHTHPNPNPNPNPKPNPNPNPKPNPNPNPSPNPNPNQAGLRISSWLTPRLYAPTAWVQPCTGAFAPCAAASPLPLLSRRLAALPPRTAEEVAPSSWVA